MEFYIACSAPEATNLAESVLMLRTAHERALQNCSVDVANLILQRIFCSDVYTQAPQIEQLWPTPPLTQRIYIGQPPLDSAFCSMQCYHIPHIVKKNVDAEGNLLVQHGAYTSLWTLAYPELKDTSENQCATVIAQTEVALLAHKMCLNQHTLRTWYYVRDVDNNYAGMVRSRTARYEALGLTPQTRFIASTGIEALAPRPHVLVHLHAHSMTGLIPEQVTYLKALSHLSPTHIYGVNFERATLVRFGDRRHCRISGTASIDAGGKVVHAGDVVGQLHRTLENIEALLDEGGMKLEHLQSAIVYLRDGHDYRRIAPLLEKLLPAHCAVNVVQGSVCRPDWLVEMEGEAVMPDTAPYPSFC